MLLLYILFSYFLCSSQSFPKKKRCCSTHNKQVEKKDTLFREESNPSMKSVTDMKIKDMKGIMIDKTPIKAKNGQLIADMESSIPRENLSSKISQPKDTRSPILSGSNCIVPASTTKENDVRQSHDCKLKIDGSSSHEPKDVTQTKVYDNIQNNAMSTGNCPFTKKLSGDSVEKNRKSEYSRKRYLQNAAPSCHGMVLRPRPPKKTLPTAHRPAKKTMKNELELDQQCDSTLMSEPNIHDPTTNSDKEMKKTQIIQNINPSSLMSLVQLSETVVDNDRGIERVNSQNCSEKNKKGAQSLDEEKSQHHGSAEQSVIQNDTQHLLSDSSATGIPHSETTNTAAIDQTLCWDDFSDQIQESAGCSMVQEPEPILTTEQPQSRGSSCSYACPQNLHTPNEKLYSPESAVVVANNTSSARNLTSSYSYYHTSNSRTNTTLPYQSLHGLLSSRNRCTCFRCSYISLKNLENSPLRCSTGMLYRSSGPPQPNPAAIYTINQSYGSSSHYDHARDSPNAHTHRGMRPSSYHRPISTDQDLSTNSSNLYGYNSPNNKRFETAHNNSYRTRSLLHARRVQNQHTRRLVHY